MDLVDLLKAVANTRARVALLVGVGFVAYLPHACTATETHIGLPPATTLLASTFWPALGAFLLYLMSRYLPVAIVWTVHALHTSKRRWVAGLSSIGVLGLCVIGVLAWPELPVVRGIAGVVLLVAIMAGGIALMLVAARLEPRAGSRSNESTPHDFAEIATHARAATNTIVGALGVVALLLVYGLMLQLPLAAGGLSEPCVRVAVSASDLPAGVRDALLGELARKTASSGLELTPPTRILRKDATEAFLWMGAGRGVTIPLSRIAAIEDYDEAGNGCLMSAAQIAGELGEPKPKD